MLDQNTDRMWYVIGAVIVGAALIFLMNRSFPALFGTIGTTFEEKAAVVTEDIRTWPVSGDDTQTDGAVPSVRPPMTVGANLLTPSKVTVAPYAKATITDLSAIKLSVLNGDIERWTGGLTLYQRDMQLKPETSYVLSYSYQKTAGDLVSFGGHIDEDISPRNGNAVYVDGKLNSVDYKDKNSAYVGNDTKRHTVEVHFTTSAVPLAGDKYIWIQPNREVIQNVDVMIYDLSLAEVTSGSPIGK